MARTLAWRSAAAAVLAAGLLACREEITAIGRCPELCPADSLTVVDTVISGIVVSDTSIRGFTRTDRSQVIVTSDRATHTAYGVLRFQRMPQFWLSGADTIQLGTIDSIGFDVQLAARDTSVDHTRLRLYRLPATVDTSVTFDSVSAIFSGLPLDTIPIADSIGNGALRVLLTVNSWRPVAADSFAVAMGIAVRGDSATAAVLSAIESGVTPLLRFYVHGAAPRDTFRTVIVAAPLFDSYVQTPEPAPPPVGSIVIGNQPASRAFLRFNIPSYFVDSVSVVRATLQLTPTRPVRGFPRETYGMVAQPLLRFFGGKSLVFQDTTGLAGRGSILTGDSTTIGIEMVRIIRFWRGIPTDSLPRAIVLRSLAEDISYGEVDVSGSAAGAAAPTLRISYVRPFRFGVP